MWVIKLLSPPAGIRLLTSVLPTTVYPKKYAYGFVVLCFVVVMQSFIMNSHEVFIHIHQGCFAGTGAIVRLPQCQWSKPDWYGKISQCITTTKHSKAKTVCIFLGIYCIRNGTWISHYIQIGSSDVITHSRSNVNCGWAKSPLKLWYEWVITIRLKPLMWLFIHVPISVNHS